MMPDVAVSTDSVEDADFDLELRLLLEAIHAKYCYDFRGYSFASMRRRMRQALTALGCDTLSQVQDRVLRDRRVFSEVLQLLTVPFSEMFRDPPYFLSIREQVAPHLRTYPSIKVWIAGCSTGEEVYSMAILLAEEGLLDRSLIYATDVNPEALVSAERGVYAFEQVRSFSANYQRSGGRRSLSDYYAAAYGGVAFDRSLRSRVVFADHSLATDSVFAEVHLVSCRNVLIYFNRALQSRAVGLFRDSLVHMGFLGLGMRETLRFSEHAGAFLDFMPEHRVYRRR
ncbi:CheR family methyltransferase [Sorangium sp. So ce1036]|uniref:CheR family methyltransferase n=1 Tax=Sorangium sp. So ce1036 TaxID=3133328 RepID=UPI003F0A5EA7